MASIDPPPYEAYLQPPPHPPSRTPSRASSGSGRDSISSDGGGRGGGGSSWGKSDPRLTSTQSLVPSAIDVEFEPGNFHRRRILLVIYIHGFYGTAQSFQSFPHHVHTFLQTALSETHAVHTKIYPRYKCYRALEVARDNFSAWLHPHESPNTDVILIGHSMGGLLSADVVLMPNQDPYSQYPFKHRILGTVSLDTPFLGLHPGIIVSGISSLFAGGQDKPPEAHSEVSSLNSGPSSSVDVASTLDSLILTDTTSSVPSIASPSSGSTADPFFNPPFWNDMEFKEQPFLARLKKFANKHKAEGVYGAVRNHVLSHLEYAGSMADYPALNQRYNKLRSLEDVDELRALSEGQPPGSRAQVRFVNYFTISSGRPKASKSKSSISNMEEATRSRDISPDLTEGVRTPSRIDANLKYNAVPDVSVNDEASDTSSLFEMQHIPPIPEEEPPQDLAGDPPVQDIQTVAAQAEKAQDPTADPPVQDIGTVATQVERAQDQPVVNADDLPPIPPAPSEPVLPNLDLYTDKAMRKQAEKESKRIQRAYDQAVKDRVKALREREKLLQKRQKKADKNAQKRQKEERKEEEQEQRKRQEEEQQEMREQEQQEEARRQHVSEHGQPAATSVDSQLTPDAARTIEEARALQADAPGKQRKFCTLPRKRDGVMDPTWIDIYMDGVDEVGAHTGLFFPGPHYDRLVGDVGSRILGWIEDDLSKKAVFEAMS
ncbi:hypothetical protein S7711_06027 [Stachybotrys chartarum IBT 7711]|uniref:DUF676 domain-containing protein n=1 Tax=Stachybotrys chartarum (strain CBS 109288 / IBT 7711) TaxID=1280523 RepID=A0A084B1Y8_STACB|nr:hypothetical protein S7711_06027 [Stachybotrys chartarum IBT 7711]